MAVGYHNLLAFWLGGAGVSTAAPTVGFRSLLLPGGGIPSGAGATPPPVAAPDYALPRRPRRIILPDGRTVEPQSEAEYRRIVAKVLAEHAPEMVETVAVPVSKRKRSRSIGQAETRYRIDEDAMARIEATQRQGDEMTWQALVAAARFNTMVMADDDAIAAILMVVA